MYKIIGADQTEYGPVGAEAIRQWIREGRANAHTRIRAEGGTDWRPLGSLPEFAPDLAGARPIPSPPFFTPPPGTAVSGRTNGMAIAGFVFGLLGVSCCCCGPPFPLLGLIFSCIGYSQTGREPLQKGRGLAIAGIILSVVGMVLSGGMLISWLVGAAGGHY